MTIRIPRGARRMELSISLGNTPSEALELRMFQNDLSITDDIDVSAFTEATFAGYKAMPLDSRKWAFSDDMMLAKGEHPMVEAVCMADNQEQTVYGYYVVGVDSQRLRWCERFDTPAIVQNIGDRVQVVPVFDVGVAQ